MAREKKNILILHHNDRDGIFSAMLMYIYLKQINSDNTIGFISANYTESIKDMIEKEIPNSLDDIYIVDYSISNDNDANYVVDLSKDHKVTWIDHHDSSIKYMDTCDKSIGDQLRNLHGLRVKGLAACALTYIYTHSDIREGNVKLLDAINNSFYTVYNLLKMQYSDQNKEIPKNLAHTLLYNLGVPTLILMAHKYDIHDLNLDVLYFSYGEYRNDPTDLYLIGQIRDKSDEYAKLCIEKGRHIYNYISKEDENDVNEYGFELTINFEDLSIRGERSEKKYKVFVLNTTHFTSLTFGNKMDIYDICIAFTFNGDKYKYSMYTKKENINVAELCSCLGGGGHPQAAGFTSNDLLLIKDGTFIIKKFE